MRDDLIAAVREAGGTQSVDVAAEEAAAAAPTETTTAEAPPSEEDRLAKILRLREENHRKTEEQRAAARTMSSSGGDVEVERRAHYTSVAEQEALSWCHRQWGSLAGARDEEFDVMLAKGGPVALLMVAELSDEGRARFLRRFAPVGGATPPSLEQLQLARAICGAVEAAIFRGEESPIWELLRRGQGAIFAKQDSQKAVVVVLRNLVTVYRRTAASADTLNSSAAREQARSASEFRITKSLQRLSDIEPAFRDLQRDDLVSLLAQHPRLEPLGIATKASLLVGAFGYRKEPHEDDGAATKRVKRLFELALKPA